MSNEQPIIWPSDGDQLVVQRVQPVCRLGRSIVGLVDGKPYACDRMVFDVIWNLRAEVRR